MSRPRYLVENELIAIAPADPRCDLGACDLPESIRVTIIVERTGRSESAVAEDYEAALRIACRRLGITPGDLDDEFDVEPFVIEA